MKKLRIVLILALFISLAMPLIAGGSNEEAAGPVTITYWDFKFEEEVSGAAFREMDALFMEDNPDIIINHVAQSEDGYYAALMAAFTAGTDVDVILTHTDNRGWNLSDFFTTLDDSIADVKGDYAPAALAACSESGDANKNIKMLPLTSQGLGIYYNKANFIKAGLDPEKAPVELNEFLAACEALKAAGIPPIIMGNQGSGYSIDFLYRVVLATFYGNGIDGFKDGSSNFTDSEYVEASRIIKSLFEMDYVNVENPSIAYFMDAINLFKSGEGGFFVGLTSDIAHWKDFGDALGYENVGYFSSFVAPDAKYPNAQVNQGAGIALASINYSKNVEAAVKYIKSYTSGERGKVFMDASGAIVPNSTIPIDSSNAMLSDILDKMSMYAAPDIMTRVPGGMVGDFYNIASLFFLADEISLDEYIEKLQKIYETNM